jgi:DNA-binding transcriptional LysR family regulator
MARAPRHGRKYKEVRLQQLRSFCETARLGSLTAAAASLGLAQPTVWEQVHALERDFDTVLIQREPHGCRLTEAGRLLAEMAAPLVAGIDSLKHRLQAAQANAVSRLTVAATQRILVEDLPATIAHFEQRHPHVHLCLVEQRVEQIPLLIESGEADLGLTTESATDPPSPWLVFEPCYELELFLVTPREHPLAQRHRLRLEELVAYPLVNAADGIPDPVITARLNKLGVFQTGPRRVEAYYSAVIRRYVEMGFGIGLVLGLPGHGVSSNLHERSLSQHLGRVTINLVSRAGTLEYEPARSFARILRSLVRPRRNRAMKTDED